MIEADVGQQLEDVIDELVLAGRYSSRSDVLREGVRLVKERELRLADLDEALERGIADANAGRVRPASAVFDELTAKYESVIQAER